MIRLRRGLVAASYVLGALLILAVTIALVAYGKGYSYDFKNHRFILNGLVLLDTNPEGAQVTLGGKVVGNTPYRSTLPSGDYDLIVSKDGFRTWSKTLRVIASEVSFAQYIILFPDKLETSVVKLPHMAGGLSVSPNHRRFVYFTGGKTSEVWLYDLGTKQSQLLFTARDGKTPERFKNVAWSDDNNHLLLSSAIGKRNHFVWLSANPSSPQATDLTDLFNQDFTQLSFDPTNPNQLYGLSTAGNLHRINLSDRTISAVLASNVRSLAFGAGHVFYVQTTSLGQSLFSLERSGLKIELIQSLANSPSYQIVYDNYKNRDSLVVIPAKAATATLYQDFFGAHLTAKVIGTGVSQVTRSPSGRFLTVYGKSEATYDLEKDERFELTPIKNAGSISWFDDFHLLEQVGDAPYIVEFDGGNQTALTPGLQAGSFAALDHSAVIGLDQNPTKTSVVYEQLR